MGLQLPKDKYLRLGHGREAGRETRPAPPSGPGAAVGIHGTARPVLESGAGVGREVTPPFLTNATPHWSGVALGREPLRTQISKPKVTPGELTQPNPVASPRWALAGSSSSYFFYLVRKEAERLDFALGTGGTDRV